ncbi:MAG TPA: FtsQ-type POTRA domain-containing protein [Candidatus Hydrogenedentes bacterium]|nr:FtsQ-type POTRA domain-containing protein [Candidatus Hydrogenedentota bacterium]HOL75930.1 FtsQ-type POTRA domain-containing protein [Candidatus Hydrogenedentota bacterium]HPO85661.1 FtsQ-type POTRA domain-containing protein [Candidatus Hydrogenedentota bacterium]
MTHEAYRLELHTYRYKPMTVRRHIRRIIRWLCVLGLLCGFGYGFAEYLHDAKGFRLQRIRIAGTEHLDPDTVVNASGLTSADNVLLLNTQAVAKRLLANPYIKNCKIRRVLPNSVEIFVEERIPSATVMIHNRTFTISEDGVVLEEIPNAGEHIGPLITDIPGIDIVEPGQNIANAALTAAFEVFRAFSKTEFATTVQISEISARHPNDIRLYCDNLPFEIRWGRGDFETQARRLDALWKYKNRQLDFNEYCDLRFGQDVACR